MSPYQILTVGSLVQREATPEDFAKVARVIYNRLAENRTLEFDSTVNYPLDRIEVATTDGDRGHHTAWNTYVRPGLPATPICSPGQPALAAAEKPEPGDWLYFVTIDMQGTTLFTRDYQQHLANIELAKRNGVLDSAAVAVPRREDGGSRVAGRAFPFSAAAPCGLPRVGPRRLELRAHRVHSRAIAYSRGRFRTRVDRRLGDHARQVRRVAVRRRTHPACGVWWVRRTLWCGRRRGGVPTTPTSTGSLARWARTQAPSGAGRAAAQRSCWGRAVPRLLWSSAWQSLACNGSPWWPVTRTGQHR